MGRRKQVTNACYRAISFDLGEFKSKLIKFKIKLKVVSLRKWAISSSGHLNGFHGKCVSQPDDFFLALILLANVWMWSIFSIAYLLWGGKSLYCLNALKYLPLFGCDNMETYFHVLSSASLFKMWARNLWQDFSRSLSMLTKQSSVETWNRRIISRKISSELAPRIPLWPCQCLHLRRVILKSSAGSLNNKSLSNVVCMSLLQKPDFTWGFSASVLQDCVRKKRSWVTRYALPVKEPPWTKVERQ